MVTLILNALRFLRYLYFGLKRDPEFRSIFLFIVVVLAMSTFFYTQEEGWSLVDALYFSVMTMSTIGYGDLVPTSTLSKIFTLIYTFLSIGAFVSLTAKMVNVILSTRHKRKYYE